MTTPRKKKTAQEAAPAADELRIEYMRLDELLRWPGNPKEHAEEAIAASIARFGFRDPLAIDEASGRIVAGHGRLSVLEKAHAAQTPLPQYVRQDADGMWLIPVTRGGHFDDEAEASAYLVATNRTSEIGGWDHELLSAFVEPLDDVLKGLTGFDWPELDPVTSDPASFLDGIITQHTLPAAAATEASPSAAQEAVSPPPDTDTNPYMQVVYVVRKDERDRVMKAIKDARERFTLGTAPEAFMRIVDAYLEAQNVQ